MALPADDVGPEIADAIADLVGGASATVRQYVSGAGEVVTVERFDRHGISEGEHGVFTGKARVSFVTGDGTIVTEYQGESETPSDTWFEPHTKVTEEHLRMPAAPAQAWDLPRGPSAVADYDGNTVDYAVEMLEPFDVGYGELAQLLLGDSLAALYAETVDWFSHEGQWFIDGYGDIADQVGDAELLRLQQIELELGKGKGAEEREDRVAGGISSPIAIDLNGDGVQTVGFIHHDVPFDITGDGAPERTAWLSGSDGFVVHDKNRNGRVDGQVELFGGQDRGVGYAELSIFDSNGDRMVSSVDDRYAELMVWQDRNMDAQTDPGELRSLSDAGIDRLALDHVNVNRWQNGNLVGEASTAEVEGERREMADVYLFHVDSSPPAALSPEAMADLLIHAAAAMPPADGGARVAFPPNLHREPFPSLAVGA